MIRIMSSQWVHRAPSRQLWFAYSTVARRFDQRKRFAQDRTFPYFATIEALLIRGFGVRVPGGAPPLTWAFTRNVLIRGCPRIACPQEHGIVRQNMGFDLHVCRSGRIASVLCREPTMNHVRAGEHRGVGWVRSSLFRSRRPATNQPISAPTSTAASAELTGDPDAPSSPQPMAQLQVNERRKRNPRIRNPRDLYGKCWHV